MQGARFSAGAGPNKNPGACVSTSLPGTINTRSSVLEQVSAALRVPVAVVPLLEVGQGLEGAPAQQRGAGHLRRHPLGQLIQGVGHIVKGVQNGFLAAGWNSQICPHHIVHPGHVIRPEKGRNPGVPGLCHQGAAQPEQLLEHIPQGLNGAQAVVAGPKAEPQHDGGLCHHGKGVGDGVDHQGLVLSLQLVDQRLPDGKGLLDIELAGLGSPPDGGAFQEQGVGVLGVKVQDSLCAPGRFRELAALVGLKRFFGIEFDQFVFGFSQDGCHRDRFLLDFILPDGYRLAQCLPATRPVVMALPMLLPAEGQL